MRSSRSSCAFPEVHLEAVETGGPEASVVFFFFGYSLLVPWGVKILEMWLCNACFRNATTKTDRCVQFFKLPTRERWGAWWSLKRSVVAETHILFDDLTNLHSTCLNRASAIRHDTLNCKDATNFHRSELVYTIDYLFPYLFPLGKKREYGKMQRLRKLLDRCPPWN